MLIKNELNNRMENYINDYSLENELSLLPINYTIDIALRNNDLIYDQMKSYNTERFINFIENYEKGILDKIKITKFEIDSKATTSILQFDGNIIQYTIDVSRFNTSEKYITYFGHKMFSHTECIHKKEFEVYYLITNKSNVVDVFVDLMQ